MLHFKMEGISLAQSETLGDFVISHATLVTETEDVDMLVTFNELIKICMQNGWEIDYTYKM